MRDTLRFPLEPEVTDIGTGKHVSVRVTFGPYSTICKPQDVWDVKQQMKRLPIICPTCRKEILSDV